MLNYKKNRHKTHWNIQYAIEMQKETKTIKVYRDRILSYGLKLDDLRVGLGQLLHLNTVQSYMWSKYFIPEGKGMQKERELCWIGNLIRRVVGI